MQFDKLTYDITTVPVNKLVIDKFPILKEYWELSDPAHDMLLRIAILTTDQQSPFVRIEREDYEKRLSKVFEYLVIRDDELLSEISKGLNNTFEAMVNRIYMMSDNLAYVMWADKLRMFHYIGLSLRQPPNLSNMEMDMTKRANLDKKRTDIYNDLVEYEAQIFTDIPTRNKIRKQITKLLQPAEQKALDKQVI